MICISDSYNIIVGLNAEIIFERHAGREKSKIDKISFIFFKDKDISYQGKTANSDDNLIFLTSV